MIKLGVLSTLVGPFEFSGTDGVRGVQLALDEFGYRVGGEQIELMIEATNAMPQSAVDAAEKLLRDGADFIVGPLSGNEGVAIRDLANKHPHYTFINGVSGSQNIYNPAPNFFSFSGNGVQFAACLGNYCYHNAGFRRMVTLGEAYSYPYAQVAGFGMPFTEAGGVIVESLWCALGTKEYGPYIEQIPDDVDAIYSTLGGADGRIFIAQYREHERDLPLAGGSIFGDASVLNFMRDHADLLNGVICSGPISDDNPDPAWQEFVDRYLLAFPDGFYSPSLMAYCFYTNTKAALLALQQVDCDLSDGQQHFQRALAKLEFYTPTGPVRLDHHHAAIATMFINEIRVSPDGIVYTHMLDKYPDVSPTLGMSDEEYLAMGVFDHDNMPWHEKKLNPLQERLKAARKKDE